MNTTAKQRKELRAQCESGGVVYLMPYELLPVVKDAELAAHWEAVARWLAEWITAECENRLYDGADDMLKRAQQQVRDAETAEPVADKCHHVWQHRYCPAHDSGDPGYPPGECDYCQAVCTKCGLTVNLRQAADGTKEGGDE